MVSVLRWVGVFLALLVWGADSVTVVERAETRVEAKAVLDDGAPWYCPPGAFCPQPDDRPSGRW